MRGARWPARPASQARAASRYVLPTIRSWVSTTASARSAMAHRDTSVSGLCRELGIRPVTLYRCVGPPGELREGQGQKVLAS